MNKSVDQLIDELIQREGDYVDHPADRGGPTRYGITEAVARATGYAGNMRDFPRSTAVILYKRDYWDKPKLGEVAKLAPRLAVELFDTGVNMGVKTAVEFLQRSLSALNRQGRDYPDLIEDGAIGPATIFALKTFLNVRGFAAGEIVLLKAVEALQGARYLEIAGKNPAQEAFLYGWLQARIGNA